MLRRILFLTLFVCSLSGEAFSQLGDNDTQFWSETWLYAPKFIDSFDYGYTNYTRFGRDVTKLTDERQALFVTYNLMPELKFTQHISYMEQNIPNANLNRTTQLRPMTDAHGKFDFDVFRVTYRLRAERQFRDDFRDRWNFRPRIGFEIPFSIGDFKPYLFANTEAFYTSDSKTWYRLRNLYGVGGDLTKSIALDLYVGQQLQSKPSQTDYGMFGFILKIKL